MTGRDGVTLSEHWADGMRTQHGIHVHGFPNLFFVQPTQGANLISNVPHNLIESARTIAAVVRHAADGGFGTVEVTRERRGRLGRAAADRAGQHDRLDRTARPATTTTRARTRASSSAAATPTAPARYFDYIDKWRASGTFEGLEFR